jgi:hypothetical protein
MAGGLFENTGGDDRRKNPVSTGADLLEVMAHPITAVYVDERALVCYERFEASPLILNLVSPLRSRITAKERAEAALEHAPEVNGVRLYDVTISETRQVGLTYRELVLQTRKAIEDSYALEQKLNDRALEKMKKYKLI